MASFQLNYWYKGYCFRGSKVSERYTQSYWVINYDDPISKFTKLIAISHVSLKDVRKKARDWVDGGADGLLPTLTQPQQ